MVNSDLNARRRFHTSWSLLQKALIQGRSFNLEQMPKEKSLTEIEQTILIQQEIVFTFS